MSVTISTALVATGDPQSVQLSIDGLPSGEAYTVLGVLGESTWPVPGGVGVSTGGVVALLDNRTPLRAPFIYRVLCGGQVYESAPLTVPYAAGAVLQSLDGDTVVPFEWVPNRLPREENLRAVAFDVPGRARPPVRTAPSGDGGGSIVIRTAPLDSTRLREGLLRPGGVAVLRTDGGLLDFPASALLLVTKAPSRASWDVQGLSADRTWTIEYLLIDDPQPTTVLSAWSWDDFDAAGLTWDQLDALALTWDEFDVYPWGQL